MKNYHVVFIDPTIKAIKVLGRFNEEWFTCFSFVFCEIASAIFKTALFVCALRLLFLCYQEDATFEHLLDFIGGGKMLFLTALLFPFAYVLDPANKTPTVIFFLKLACSIVFSICILLLILFGGSAKAASLTVVEDHGGVSALPYYERLQPNPQNSNIREAKPIVQQGPVTEAQMLPVVSRKLSPGRFAARTNNAGGLIQPLFLVGTDELSVAWLKQRGAALREIGAVGLVVNVSDASSLAALRKVADGLTLIPASGDDIAGLLNIDHYPVLITRTGIEQ
ncbi:MAG: integrating conjugative element protein [Burkholderiales bacterium]|jgi:integrating conjugative element protein (TIGR03765 family)|nr:integrating conjugative element protein [Burkholderiales bacterium]